MSKHPMQPVELDKDGIPRFKPNEIVKMLLDDGPWDLNRLYASNLTSDEDYTQLMQLIGYSVGGYSELRASPEDTIEKANELASKLLGNEQKFVPTPDYQKVVAIDFDGVLHEHKSPWTTTEEINDGPTPGALQAVKDYLAADLGVVVFSVRARLQPGYDAIEAWLEKHGFPFDDMEITSMKPSAHIYIDDRGWQFNGIFPSVHAVKAFKPWNK